MPDKVTISHRGAKYQIGRGKRYYGIWVIGAPEDAPVDRWPETPDGWAQAWSRFAAIETPGTIAEVERRGFAFPKLRLGRAKAEDGEPTPDRPRASAATRVAAVTLLALGVILGVAGLFPQYFGGGASLATQAFQIVPHLCYLAGWAAGGVLLAAGGRKARVGALLGLGLSAVTLGMFLSDLGYVLSGQNEVGAGLVLGLVSWAACAAGSVAGIAVRGAAGTGPLGGPARPQARHAGPLTLLGLGAVGTAVAFAPAWDSYTLASQSGSQTFTAGNAFSEPAVIIAGNVLVMAALIAAAIVAALWRPARHGAALLAGAIVPMAAQAISALIQVNEPASPSDFGISQSQASAAGLTITSGVTPVFWVYCVFVIALVISCAWLLAEPGEPVSPSGVPSSLAGPITPPPVDDPVDYPVDDPVDDTEGAGDSAVRGTTDGVTDSEGDASTEIRTDSGTASNTGAGPGDAEGDTESSFA